jgi:hypothetical protein
LKEHAAERPRVKSGLRRGAALGVIESEIIPKGRKKEGAEEEERE